MTVQFRNTSEEPISSVDWDFGDGTTSTEQNPDHVYTIAGSYTVQLTVSGPGFAVAVAKIDLIAVQPGPPVSLEVVPPFATLAVLESAQFEAALRDEFGNVVPVAPNWTVIAEGGSIDPSGMFTAGTVVGSFADTAMAFSLTKTGDLIAAAASVTVTATGLIAHWSFDEGSGSTANDSTGNGNTGALVNGPAWVDGKFGKALDFSGSNDYVLIPHNDLIDFAANEDFSISFWFKDSTKSGSDNASGHELMEKQDSDGVFYQIRSPSHNGSLRFQVDDGVDQDRFNSSVGNLADGLWHHVVFIREYDTSITAYVDGVFAGSDSTVSARSIANTVDLRLGRGTGKGDYDGLLDEVRFYNRDLTPQEVVDLFNAAADVTPLSTPTGLATSSVSIPTSWTASADPESGIAEYVVYR